VCSAKALALFAAIRRIRRIKTIKDCGCSGGLFWLKWVGARFGLLVQNGLAAVGL
jgi:hypothetical protein